MATLKDIAKRAGLSVTQVSRALNNHSDVNADTREMVQAIARSMQYQPNLSARKLVMGRSGMVGLVISQSSGMSLMEEVAGLSMQFSDRNKQFLLHIAREGDPILPVYKRLVGIGSLDGFVLIHPRDDDERAHYLREVSVPFVVHGRIGESPDHPYYDIDNEGIFYHLTQHLLALGHRRIGFLNGVEGRSYVTARRRGYLRALAEFGLGEEAALIRNGEMIEGLGLTSTVALMTQEAAPPTALICGNSYLARGAVQALGALKLSIPDDVSVVAHDDLVPGVKTDAFYPALTVSEAALSDSWAPLADFLTAAIEGAALESVQMIGSWHFRQRSSTSSPRN